ncbi:MAG: DNA replication initiation factor cdc45, partial [Marteilia pararefringens]
EFRERKEDIEFLLLINCGIDINIRKFLDLNRSQKIYIIDYRRPINLKNLYDPQNIYLLLGDSNLKDIPPEDIVLANADKRIANSDWFNRRKEAILKYKSFITYGEPTSYLLFKLACKLGKESIELLWYCVISLTSQFLSKKIDKSVYREILDQMEMYCSNLNATDSESIDVHSIYSSNILRLCFYKHWNAYSSITNTIEIASLFRLFCERGKDRLDEFLAKLGISLTDSHQKFNSMDDELKKIFDKIFLKHLPEHGFHVNEFFIECFIVKYGFGNAVSTIDMHYICKCIFEDTLLVSDTSSSMETNFIKTVDLLGLSLTQQYDSIIKKATMHLEKVTSLIQYLIDAQYVLKFKDIFFYCSLKSDFTIQNKLLWNSTFIANFSYLLYTAFMSCRQSNPVAEKPFILTVNEAEEKIEKDALVDVPNHYSIIYGFIPRKKSQSNRNISFKQIFKQAAFDTGIKFQLPYINQSIIRINSNDQLKLLTTVSRMLV